MNPEDLLSQLRNLDTPGAISWWPPAPGWWALASLILLGLIAAIYIAIRNYLHGAAARSARSAIHSVYDSYLEKDPSAAARSEFLQEINAILKRLAANYQGNESVASLSGQAWRNYLSEVAPELSATELDPFSSAIYQPQPQIDVDEVMLSLDLLVDRLRRVRRA